MAPDINVNITGGDSGDKSGGDKVTTGDISGDGIAVGRQASASAGGMAGFVNDLIAEIMRRLTELERRIMQLEVHRDYTRHQDRNDRASVNGNWIGLVGGFISILLILLMVWLATSGYR